MTKYYVVTAISQFRMRYVVPVENIKDENGNVHKEWAMDSVAMQEIKEFSQEHLGEVILDVVEENEEQVLTRFDEENTYLKQWDKDVKIKYIKNWKETI